MEELKVSVIIPTYSPKDYLRECLESLANQTFDKRWYEVIIVLNGCKEPYQSTITDFIRKYPVVQFKLIQTDEAGVSNARNIGIDHARGEFITFIDDDDYVSPSYIEGLYEKSGVDTVALAYPFAFEDGSDKIQLNYRITNEYNRLSSFERLEFYKARKYFSGPCMKMIHYDIINCRRFDKRLKNGEDTLFMFEISDKIKYVSFASNETVYYRRFRANSATTASRSTRTKIKDNMVGLSAYVSIYLRNIKGYKFSFFLTRVLGAICGMFV